MPALQKIRVKKVGKGNYKVAGRAGRSINLLPQDRLKHQTDPIGAEFDILAPPNTPISKVIRRVKK